MAEGSTDGFESFRRERNRRRRSEGPLRPMGRNANVLRELEMAEEEEARNQQLSREVHEFFADATRTAADIVTRVAEDAESVQEVTVGRDMAEFLESTIQRAQEFVLLMRGKNPGISTTEIQTNMHNIVGATLDEFRSEGTAQLGDKHIGQDPFADEDGPAPTSLGESPHGGPAFVAPQSVEVEPGEPPSIDEHLVADESYPVAEDEQPVAEQAAEPVEPAPKPKSDRAPGDHAAPDRPSRTPSLESLDPLTDWLDRVSRDTQTLQTALKLLVHGGVMTKSEAKAIYRQIREAH